MPVNAGPEYFLAEKKYLKARTREEKIEAIKEMIRTLPKHKGSENVLAQLRHRRARLEKELKTEKKKAGKSFEIQKLGSARVCLLGVTKSGKSSLLKILTGKDVEISEKPYTTTKPEVGMMDYNGVKIQIIEIPATFEPKYLGLLHTAELILCLIDSTQEKRQKEILNGLLENRKLLAKIIFVTTKSDLGIGEVSAATGKGIEELREKIWKSLRLIKVYPKPLGKPPSNPMSLPIGSTLKEFVEKISRAFLKSFKFARIYDKTKFSGRKVGLNYELKDGDIIELHLE